MNDGSIQHVSDTAFMVAHCRAIESQRNDALFRDPLAGRLAGERGRAIIEAFPTAPMTTWLVAIRTVVIDEFIRYALDQGVDTIVNLGAGLDTRPYRLDLPKELNWIEVDYPDVIEFKRERLNGEVPRCRLEQVGLDLSNLAARREFLDKIDERASHLLVLTEGVVPYLDVEQAGSLADDLSELKHLKAWIVDYISKESHQYRQRAGVNRHMEQAPFKFRPEDWFAFFDEHGFRVREVRYLAERAAELDRPAPLPLRYRLLMALARRFTPVDKRGRFQKFAGYAWLEPRADATGSVPRTRG